VAFLEYFFLSHAPTLLLLSYYPPTLLLLSYYPLAYWLQWHGEGQRRRAEEKGRRRRVGGEG